MREIKFRAWDKVNNDMALDVHHLDSLNEILSREKWYVMQYTGLKDRNGKEIYEGDVLESVGEVRFNDGCFITKDGIPLIMSQFHRAVIGNIYENPELLNL